MILPSFTEWSFNRAASNLPAYFDRGIVMVMVGDVEITFGCSVEHYCLKFYLHKSVCDYGTLFCQLFWDTHNCVVSTYIVTGLGGTTTEKSLPEVIEFLMDDYPQLREWLLWNRLC